jgi:protein SSD1
LNYIEKRFYLDKDTVQKTANHCNVKKEAAKNAQEQSSHLFLCVLLRNLSLQSGPVIREAIVIGVKDHAFDVLVPVFCIEKRVHLDQLPLEKFIFNDETGDLTLLWKSGVSSLEPILDDGSGDEDDVLDVDEDALLVDDHIDYHYELMDVTSRPYEDENRLFDANSDNGEDDVDDEITGDENDVEVDQDTTTITTVPAVSVYESYESPKMDTLVSEASTSNQSLSAKTSSPTIKMTEIPQLQIDSDPEIPNSQIIRELCHLQVVITADCKKSPPVIKVLAINPYA